MDQLITESEIITLNTTMNTIGSLILSANS
jgi:hypothetical protein